MAHIFISYSHKDKAYVHRLAETLQNENFDVWIDDRIDYGTRREQTKLLGNAVCPPVMHAAVKSFIQKV